jgi:hypothetical protein
MALGVGNQQTVTTDTSGTAIAQINSVVQQNAAFQAAMRQADNMNTQESMASTLTLNANQGQRKTLETATEAQNADVGRRPQAISQLYRS